MKKKIVFFSSYILFLFVIFLIPIWTAVACDCYCTKTVNNSETYTCSYGSVPDEATCGTTCTNLNTQATAANHITYTFYACTATDPTQTAGSTGSCILNKSSDEKATGNDSSETASFNNPIPFFNFFNKKSLAEVVGLIIKGILGLMGIAALVIFIYAGFIWMFAQGNSTKIKHAVDIMKYCALGIAIIYLSYAMLKFIFGIIK